jgi:hypothetical protein
MVADDVAQLMDALGIASAVQVGTSGACAPHAAAQRSRCAGSRGPGTTSEPQRTSAGAAAAQQGSRSPCRAPAFRPRPSRRRRPARRGVRRAAGPRARARTRPRRAHHAHARPRHRQPRQRHGPLPAVWVRYHGLLPAGTGPLWPRGRSGTGAPICFAARLGRSPGRGRRRRRPRRRRGPQQQRRGWRAARAAGRRAARQGGRRRRGAPGHGRQQQPEPQHRRRTRPVWRGPPPPQLRAPAGGPRAHRGRRCRRRARSGGGRRAGALAQSGGGRRAGAAERRVRGAEARRRLVAGGRARTAQWLVCAVP